MAELDFRTAAVDEVLAAFFAEGCVLLRNCVETAKLAELQGIVDQILDATGQLHLFDRQARQNGMPHFYQYIFTTRHLAVLRAIFGGAFRLAHETHTRRIDPALGDPGWQAPLAPHIDAFFHQFRFTVNFWVPFRRCGRHAPSLGVVRAPFVEAREFVGYDGKPADYGGPDRWNTANFARYPLRLDEVEAVFAERVWTPQYKPGDAMMLSNWTLHFTHCTPQMTGRRGNLELRFFANDMLNDVVGRFLGRRVRWTPQRQVNALLGYRRGARVRAAIST